jgi:hypothetical protein
MSWWSTFYNNSMIISIFRKQGLDKVYSVFTSNKDNLVYPWCTEVEVYRNYNAVNFLSWLKSWLAMLCLDAQGTRDGKFFADLREPELLSTWWFWSWLIWVTGWCSWLGSIELASNEISTLFSFTWKISLYFTTLHKILQSVWRHIWHVWY